MLHDVEVPTLDESPANWILVRLCNYKGASFRDAISNADSEIRKLIIDTVRFNGEVIKINMASVVVLERRRTVTLIHFRHNRDIIISDCTGYILAEQL